MAVTVTRSKFVGTWLTPSEHSQVVAAARHADVTLAVLLRQAVVREGQRIVRREVARQQRVAVVLPREIAAATVRVLEEATAR